MEDDFAEIMTSLDWRETEVLELFTSNLQCYLGVSMLICKLLSFCGGDTGYSKS